MQVDITARHFDLSESVKFHVEKRMKRLSQHHDLLIYARVVLIFEQHHGKPWMAEATVDENGTEVFASSEETGDVRTAIDAVCEKLERQLSKHKDKRLNRRG